MRRAAKQDANQAEIVARLRQCAVSVEFIGKPVDLLICCRGETLLMEVKNPDGKNALTQEQVEFISRWPGKVHIVRSVDDALLAVLGSQALS